MDTRRRALILAPLAAGLALLGCGDASSLTAPTGLTPATVSLSQGAARTHVEFDAFDSNDFVLSCMNGESTHWEGWVHVTIDGVVTPSGLTQERIHVSFSPDYFVERANGVRYYAVGPFPVNEHHLFGPVTVIAGTAAGAWKSADGDVLVLGFHAQFVYDKDGNPVLEKWSGACP